MRLFQPCCRKKAQVENLNNIDKQPDYEVPYQYQAKTTKKEIEKLTEEINRLKAELNRREGANEQIKSGMEKLTQENNGLKNDIRRQAEKIGKYKAEASRYKYEYNKMRREKELLTNEINRIIDNGSMYTRTPVEVSFFVEFQMNFFLFYFQASNEALQDTSSSSSYSFTAHEDKLFITQSLAPKSRFSNNQTFDFSKDSFEN